MAWPLRGASHRPQDWMKNGVFPNSQKKAALRSYAAKSGAAKRPLKKNASPEEPAVIPFPV